jgi:DNA-binding SARP family transcriptional activator
VAGRDGLRVRILGRLDASDGDAEIDLGGRRQRAVLAVLVLARGEIVPAERIADCLWGDDLPGNVSGAVQSYVSHLRRRLQPDGAPLFLTACHTTTAGNPLLLRQLLRALEAARVRPDAGGRFPVRGAGLRPVPESTELPTRGCRVRKTRPAVSRIDR